MFCQTFYINTLKFYLKNLESATKDNKKFKKIVFEILWISKSIDRVAKSTGGFLGVGDIGCSVRVRPFDVLPR